MKSHEDKKSVNVSSISRADMESLFIQNSIYGLNVSMKPTMKVIIASSSFVFREKREIAHISRISEIHQKLISVL